MRALLPLLSLSLMVWLSGTARAEQRLRPNTETLVFRPQGTPHLMIDIGRGLDSYLREYGMRGSPITRRGSGERLSSIEKARLDARRIWSAPALSFDDKLLRLVAVVQRRLPHSPDGLTAEHKAIHAEAGPGGEGFTRLSRRTAFRAGGYFERAWLLKALLDEVGVQAKVQTGELTFPLLDRSYGEHAWVNVTVGGQAHPVFVDPSSSDLVLPTTQLATLPVKRNGRMTQRDGILALSGFFYIPR